MQTTKQIYREMANLRNNVFSVLIFALVNLGFVLCVMLLAVAFWNRELVSNELNEDLSGDLNVDSKVKLVVKDMPEKCTAICPLYNNCTQWRHCAYQHPDLCTGIAFFCKDDESESISTMIQIKQRTENPETISLFDLLLLFVLLVLVCALSIVGCIYRIRLFHIWNKNGRAALMGGTKNTSSRITVDFKGFKITPELHREMVHGIAGVLNEKMKEENFSPKQECPGNVV